MERERLGSRLGFILISAGCAIGIGNVWRFPTVAGQNGGGLFVLIYLLFLVILGIPVMTMEFAMGRAARKSPIKLYQQLEKPNHKWHIHGYFALAGNVILMMFYTSVAGWMLQYFGYTAFGKFDGMQTRAEISGVFGEMLSNPWVLIAFVAGVVFIGFLVCSFDMQKGLEKVTNIMMIALLAIMVVLAIRSFFMPGAGEGLKFYLVPSVEKVKNAGLLNVVVAAMNQAFFTLSLGMGSMAIFGSFINKDRALMGESVTIAILDTFVAITAGLIIFPACYSYNVPVDAGPSLIFETLPHVFNSMSGGRFWGSLFFIFLSFAALSTVFAVFQNILTCVCEITNWGKKRACIFCGVGLFILSIPCVLGFNLWAGFHPLGGGSGVLDLEDYIVSNILLPLGSLVVVLFCNHKFGWGFKKFQSEANEGKGLKVKNWMRGYMTYVLPVIVFILFAFGIYNFFK